MRAAHLVTEASGEKLRAARRELLAEHDTVSLWLAGRAPYDLSEEHSRLMSEMNSDHAHLLQARSDVNRVEEDAQTAVQQHKALKEQHSSRERLGRRRR